MTVWVNFGTGTGSASVTGGFTPRMNIWPHAPRMPEAPDRPGWQKITVFYEDGPLAGAARDVAYVKIEPPVKIPGSF